MSDTNQSAFFKGIYEFEDLSGTLLAAKVPASGTVDLYTGTVVVVKPSQTAIFIYKGQVADVLHSGTHTIQTDNLPLLTSLANWQFGFKNPLRCELIFVSKQQFIARRWGTPQPVLVKINGLNATIPIRSFGNFNICIDEPTQFFTELMGSRSSFSITELEETIQGQIIELLPQALSEVSSLENLSQSYNQISQKLEQLVKNEIASYGVSISKIQLLSALPSKEILEAMEAKNAIQIIGSQKEYLLYKAANSLGQSGSEADANNPMHMMMGLMLGKGIMGADYHEKEKAAIDVSHSSQFCSNCGSGVLANARFCSSCGKKV
ncbi:SPFH domain-containing protein [bacterium]|nr:SPFH domain-containing protein [bacterium]